MKSRVVVIGPGGKFNVGNDAVDFTVNIIRKERTRYVGGNPVTDVFFEKLITIQRGKKLRLGHRILSNKEIASLERTITGAVPSTQDVNVLRHFFKSDPRFSGVKIASTITSDPFGP